jgi:hypothetical protein
MESIQSKLSVGAMSAYFGIFKEPRGLIRLLQFIFAIFAFATACNGSSSETISIVSQSSAATTSWSYPYNLKTTPISGTNISSLTVSDANDVKSSAEFFVFTGVTAMLLSLAFVVAYVLLDRQYRNDERLPIADFIITVIWTIFWFAGSAAWAKGVSNIRSQTSADALRQRTNLCPSQANCPEAYSGSYANIIVSVIFGFLNFILWAGCAWFIYKETKFFKSRTAQQQPQGQPGNFSDISSPNIQQQSNIRPPGSLG